MAGENGARARKGRLALTPAVVPGNAGNPRRQTGLRYRILAWARSLAPLRILPDWKVVANPFFETQLQTVWVSLGKQTRTLYPLVKKPVGDRDRKAPATMIKPGIARCTLRLSDFWRPASGPGGGAIRDV